MKLSQCYRKVSRYKLAVIEPIEKRDFDQVRLVIEADPVNFGAHSEMLRARSPHQRSNDRLHHNHGSRAVENGLQWAPCCHA